MTELQVFVICDFLSLTRPVVNIDDLSQAKHPSKSTLSPREHPAMTLTKDHLIGSIGNRLGISKFESTRLVESVLETVKTSLSNGEDVLISGSGSSLSEKRKPGEEGTLRPDRI